MGVRGYKTVTIHVRDIDSDSDSIDLHEASCHDGQTAEAYKKSKDLLAYMGHHTH